MKESAKRVTGIQARDPDVLERIAEECLPGLLRAARASGLDAARADDTVQEVFLTFLRRAEEFDGRARVSTWLFGILFRKLCETRRTLVAESKLDDIDTLVDARFNPNGRWARPPQGPVAELGREEVRLALADCLKQVPERQRLAFHLREVEDLSTEEVCKVLEVSSNNLGVLLYRSRNRLRECLEGKGFQGGGDADLS